MHGTVKILIVINCTLLAMYNAAVILLRTHERMDKAILGVGCAVHLRTLTTSVTKCGITFRTQLVTSVEQAGGSLGSYQGLERSQME